MTEAVTAAQEAADTGTAVEDDVRAVDARRARRARVTGLVQRGGAPAALAMTLVIGGLAFGEDFLSADNLLSTVAGGSAFLALVAVGMTFVIISGGIDLSVGAVLAMSAVITATVSASDGAVAGVAAGLASGVVLGMVQGLLISKAGLPSFIVTLAGMQLARGVAFKVTDEGNTTALIGDDAWLRGLGREEVLGVPVPVIIALGAFVIGALVLTRTRFGQAVFAIGGSHEAASLMGTAVTRVTTSVYVWSGTLAALAGVLIAARSSTGEPTAGYGLELQAIAAVVIGGTLLTGGIGTMGGTLAGVALLAVVQNLINQVGTLSQYYQDVVSGAFLLVVVLLQAVLSRRRRLT